MKFKSTRQKAPIVSLSQAISDGLAPDGGLYVPTAWPTFKDMNVFSNQTFAEFAADVLGPFFSGDDLESDLKAISKEALNFPLILKELENSTSVLELFHGPTAAFKDFGARFLACSIPRIAGKNPVLTKQGPLVLVATSGDTGGAVAAAFSSLTNIPVAILYPKGKVSPRQEKQLTCWGSQVNAFSVSGDFDDCQRMAKEAFMSQEWRQQFSLLSANSINIARLLPQMTYYAHSSLEYFRKHGSAAGFIIPAGNIGNSVAALWAKHIGFPIREVVLAHNANRSVADFLSSGVWKPQTTVSTLANAMDVGNPSNIERVLDLYPHFSELKTEVRAFCVSDSQIQDTIKFGQSKWGETWCPHTATAVYVREQQTSNHWIIVSTAHPAKFESIVEPLIGRSVPVPNSLASLFERPTKKIDIPAELGALKSCLFK